MDTISNLLPGQRLEQKVWHALDTVHPALQSAQPTNA